MTHAELRRLLPQGAAAVLVAVALLSAARQLPTSVRSAHAVVAEHAGTSRLERELAPARAVDLDPKLLLRVDNLLPPDAIYHVAVGEGVEFSSAAARAAVAPLLAYWLLPRRHTADPSRAEWVVSFGAGPAEIGMEIDLVDELADGIRLLRVRR